MTIKKTLQNDRLIWIDLETTGFDNENNMLGCRKNKILEVGIHITDKKLNILDDGFRIVIHHEQQDILNVIHPTAKIMHEQNGLLAEVEQSDMSLSEAESQIIEYLTSHNIEIKSSPICGNNVSFDKNFIDAQMPLLSQFLHYRKMDVSAVKELVKCFSPEHEFTRQKNTSHRGLDDIKESIQEMKIYANLFFKI